MPSSISTHYAVREDSIFASVKAGSFFRVFYETTVLGGSVDYIYIKVPADRELGVIASQISVTGSPCKLNIYAGFLTLNTPGVQLNIFSHNAAVGTPSELIVQQGADVDYSFATKVDTFYALAAGTQGANVGSGDHTQNIAMIVIEPDQEVIVEVENIGPDVASVLVKYSWIEAILD